MNLKHLMIGGLIATALTIGMTNTASAQVVFGPGFGPSYGPSYQHSTFVTPNGGIVNRQSSYNPYSGQSTFNKSYVNPYNGTYNQRQFVSGPGYSYGSNYGNSPNWNGHNNNNFGYAPGWNPRVGPSVNVGIGLSPGFATSPYYNSAPAFTPVWGYQSNFGNPYGYRPGLSLNFNVGR